MLTLVFYVSEIRDGLTDLELQVLLGQAQIRNRRLDVTGMLAKSDGHFCQVLEGRPEAIEQIMERLRTDIRHSAMRVLLAEPVRRRLFGAWAMGLIVRDDMADEMRRLHETGALEGASMIEIIKRLMGPPGA